METKKISFGFSKINKKLNLIVHKESQKSDNKVELIKCLEGQEIKLVEEKQEEAALVIPLKENQKTSTALASLIKRRAVLLGEEEPELIPQVDNEKATDVATTNEPEDIEKRAAKELLAELNTNVSLNSDTNLVLPVVHADDLPLEGAKESSMYDYESIPIQQFGKAMLRGMGWVEPPKPTKGGPPVEEMPSVRPKGMGLGADKALKPKPLLVAPESNEVLEIKRKAYVRILGGKHKDLYGQIEGFDDHAGRVIVKMAIGGAKEAFNEFLCQPISRKEYAQYGKCINTNKYEEYKRKENEHGQIIFKEEKTDKDSEMGLKMKIKQEELDRAPDKYQSMDMKKEVYEISSEEDNKMHDRKPKQEIKEEKSSGSREKRDDYERQRNRDDERVGGGGGRRDDYREEERDRRRRDYKDDERLSRNEKKRDSEDRTRDNNHNEDKISGRERSGEHNIKNAHEKSRNRDDINDGERSRDRYDPKYENEDSSRKNDANGAVRKDQRRDDAERDRKKDYEERGNRPRRASTSHESETEERSKHKKSSKDKKAKKKSKKNKKSKSKHHDDSADSESSTSTDPEEERQKRHKKKTKKSKKQRERSRSRGRR